MFEEGEREREHTDEQTALEARFLTCIGCAHTKINITSPCMNEAKFKRKERLPSTGTALY